MKIEVGKFYRDSNDVKHGPMVVWDKDDPHPWSESAKMDDKPIFADDGTAYGSGGDLVAEWVEPAPCEGKVPSQQGPTRTVTRLEVVPGVYGSVTVSGSRGGHAFVSISAVADTASAALTADELDAAAAVLTELAKAVRDGQ